MKIKSGQNGQVLIEALVSITIATLALLGIFELLSRSLSLNKVVSDQYIAANLAAEGIEVIKNLIDSNVLQPGTPWNNGINSGVYEIIYSDTALSSSISGDPANNCNESFLRQNGRLLTLDENSGVYGYNFSKTTKYKRVVCVNNLTPDQIKVNSLVVWTTRGGITFDINLEDHFFNWLP